jgi:uncharacterized protein (DUF1778 family)
MYISITARLIEDQTRILKHAAAITDFLTANRLVHKSRYRMKCV